MKATYGDYWDACLYSANECFIGGAQKPFPEENREVTRRNIGRTKT